MLFHKVVTYYITPGILEKQVGGYIISMKRKRRMKLKAKGCAEGQYHLLFNNALTSSSKMLRSKSHKGCCVLNTNKYNYKLRSVIGREDESKVTKWMWFNKQVHDTLLCSWMIPGKLIDQINIGRAIGCRMHHPHQ